MRMNLGVIYVNESWFFGLVYGSGSGVTAVTGVSERGGGRPLILADLMQAPKSIYL